jgi:hypothetical protein
VNIDERLDMLTRIHLDQTREFHERFMQVEAQMARTDAQMARTDERVAHVMEAMNRLINIVESHEQRLDDLENQ